MKDVRMKEGVGVGLMRTDVDTGEGSEAMRASAKNNSCLRFDLID